jgi:hypothetical protein
VETRVPSAEIAMEILDSLLRIAARLDRLGMTLTRVGLVVVLVWIGGLKMYRYEDEGIVPFVANSPVKSFFYRQPAGEYRKHMNREGDVVPANREWHTKNGTYGFAHGLGSVIVVLGVMIALHPGYPASRRSAASWSSGCRSRPCPSSSLPPSAWSPPWAARSTASRSCPVRDAWW